MEPTVSLSLGPHIQKINKNQGSSIFSLIKHTQSALKVLCLHQHKYLEILNTVAYRGSDILLFRGVVYFGSF